MSITKENLIAAFEEHYEPFRGFPEDNPEIWNLLLDTATNEELMCGIKFANDYLSVPPVQSFLECRKADLCKILDSDNLTLSDQVKRATGAFWGAVFKFVLGYQDQKSIPVTVKNINVSNATVFMDQKQSA